ncbi:MAG: helix-turn-helix domain-containing protein [Flavobacteriales bacterium]|nr:helix-turn-helix domain-containing protein [Flavobacteriales bacterium]
MLIQEAKAKKELSRYIESYWRFSPNAEQHPLLLFPDGTFNVVFATQPFKMDNGKTYSKGTYLFPLLNQLHHVHSDGILVGIRYKAFALNNIVDVDIEKLDGICELTEVNQQNSVLTKIHTEIGQNPDFEWIQPLLELGSYELISSKLQLNSALRDKVNYILDRKGNVRIDELCQEFSVSRQALHKAFKKNLGISAKQLACTWRLNYFLTLIEDPDSLTSNALSAGFFDQAHSINSLKREWKFSPGAFKRLNDDTIGYVKQTMKNRFNNFYDPDIQNEFTVSHFGG